MGLQTAIQQQQQLAQQVIGAKARLDGRVQATVPGRVKAHLALLLGSLAQRLGVLTQRSVAPLCRRRRQWWQPRREARRVPRRGRPVSRGRRTRVLRAGRALTSRTSLSWMADGVPWLLAGRGGESKRCCATMARLTLNRARRASDSAADVVGGLAAVARKVRDEDACRGVRRQTGSSLQSRARLLCARARQARNLMPQLPRPGNAAAHFHRQAATHGFRLGVDSWPLREAASRP
jgi:hypothetical protein